MWAAGGETLALVVSSLGMSTGVLPGARDTGPEASLARAVGTSPGYVWEFERGRCAPSIAFAASLADALALDDADRATLRSAAVPDVGRASTGHTRSAADP